MLILMGENKVKSRQVLNSLIDKAKENGKEIIRLAGDKVELGEVKQAMEAKSLFGSQRLVVVEGIIKARSCKRKNEVLDYLKQAEEELIVWEDGKIDKRKVNGWKAEVKEFKLASVIFKLMDALAPGNTKKILKLYEKCVEDESAETIFYMITRQVRLMFQALDCESKFPGPAWLKGKMKRQAKKLGEDKLLEIHERLYEIDKGIKTGTNSLSLQAQIEMMLISL